MKQKKQTQKHLMQAKRSKLLPVWVAVLVLIALFIVYCIICPFFGVSKILGATVLNYPNPYYPAYIVGLILSMLILGLLNAYRAKDTKQTGKTEKPLMLQLVCVIGFFSGIIGAVILGKTQNALGFSEDSAVSLYGAVFFAPIFMTAVLKIMRRDLARNMDYIAIGVFCVLAFAKLGCHAVGCCWGIYTDPIMFGRGLFPVQLLESIFTFILTGFLVYLMFKGRTKWNGALYPIGMLLYSPVRFCTELLRHHKSTDYVFNGLMTFWQFLSIIGFVAGAIWLGILLWRRKKRRLNLNY